MQIPPAPATVGYRAGAPLEELFDGVDDLIKRVADTENPEIRKIRAKVHASMVVARSAFAVQGAQARSDENLREDPDQALGVALLLGVGLGVIMSNHA